MLFTHSPASRPSYQRVYDVSAVEALPRVDILIAYQGVSWDTMDAAIANGAKGFVTAGASFLLRLVAIAEEGRKPDEVLLNRYRFWRLLFRRHCFRRVGYRTGRRRRPLYQDQQRYGPSLSRLS